MFFQITCFCGAPIGRLWRRYLLAKLLSFSPHVKDAAQCDSDIQSEFASEQEQVTDFIHTSLCHMRIYQMYDQKTAIQDLVKQYNHIYPYDDMRISESLARRLVESKSIQRLFQIIHEISDHAGTEDRRRRSDDNLIKQLLDKEAINKMCCRQTVLTQTDFYDSRTFYSRILQ